MWPRILMGALALALCAGAVAYFVLQSDADPVTPQPSKTAESNEPAPKAKPAPLLEGWEKPAVALLLSGEQHGHLEPCGCSLIQLGGLSRRDDLVRQLRERGWTVTGLDVGGIVKRSRRQAQIKFETALAGLKDMNYAALAIGPEELRLGPEYLLGVHNPTDSIPFVAANVVLFSSPDVGTPVSHKIVTADSVKIGVTAVFGTSLKAEVLPANSGNQAGDIEILDPQAALPGAIEKLQAEQPDLLVLLSHAKYDETLELAAKFPQFDLILTAGGPEDPDPKPKFIGKTLVAMVGAKGKHVGVVGFYPDNKEQRLRFELVDMDQDRFQNSKRIDDHMRYYQERLRDENLAAKEPAISHPSGAQYIGAAKCGECHKKAYTKWLTSKHAHAFESLSKGRKGQEATWIPRVFDAECLACHVTGWNPRQYLRYESGYVNEQTSGHLLGQQCENCHGPGSQHDEHERKWAKDRKQTPELLQWRKAMHLDTEIAKNRVCDQCHDPDNSPAFDFDKYWKEVKHPWRD